MSAKRSNAGDVEVFPSQEASRRVSLGGVSRRMKFSGRPGTHMSPRGTASANEYLCAIEKNQNGKYNVRIRAIFIRGGWSLPVYFLASSFNAAMKKLEESLQTLQKNEEKLRFWGVERTDDPNLAGDLLKEYGLNLDRRTEFPRRAAELDVHHGRAVSAAAIAPLRRVLADSVAQGRTSLSSD